MKLMPAVSRGCVRSSVRCAVKKVWKIGMLWIFVAAMAACTTPPVEDKQPVEQPPQEVAPGEVVYEGEDGVACVGAPPAEVVGLSGAQDNALLGEAMAETDKGGLCAGRVMVAGEGVRVWRVWDGSKDYTRLGRWWSLERPSGPRDAYRAEYAICPSWSALDRLVSCTLVPGSKVAVGTTQSAACEDGAMLPKTASLQVFIPNDGRAGVFFVEACQDEGAWP